MNIFGRKPAEETPPEPAVLVDETPAPQTAPVVPTEPPVAAPVSTQDDSLVSGEMPFDVDALNPASTNVLVPNATPAVSSTNVTPDVSSTNVSVPDSSTNVSAPISPQTASSTNVPAPDVSTPIAAPQTVSSTNIAPVSTPVDAVPTPLPAPIEPPRALAPGAFLGGELEIVEVVDRGHVNFYRANAGAYGEHDFQLIAERVAASSTNAEPPASALWAPAKRWIQDEREYASWPWANLQTLEDWRPPANDETFWSVAREVASGLHALETAHLSPDLEMSCLRVDETGQIRFYGFVDETAHAKRSGLEVLTAIMNRVARRNLAPGATLRLDDSPESLPMGEEAKVFSRDLGSGKFANLGEVVAALEGFTLVHDTQTALVCDVGMERELNEDRGMFWKMARAGHDDNLHLEALVVADGMGGHEGGEIASQRTLAAFQVALMKRLALDWSDNRVALDAALEIIDETNAEVVKMNEAPPFAQLRNKPGATLTFGLRFGSRLVVGNVGDSRGYKWNARTGLVRLTKDHSYVQDLIDTGRLKEEESWGHPDGSVITSHIGMARGLLKDVQVRWVSPGDTLLFVSDGIMDTLRDSTVQEIVAQGHDAQTLANTLTQAANDAGGVDNITVIASLCV